jgi:hypothetical protein
MTIRVLVADDHGAIRAGLMLMLGSDPDIEVVGEAADGEAAVRRISAEGLAHVLVLTTFDLDEYVHAALRGELPGSSSNPSRRGTSSRPSSWSRPGTACSRRP